MVNKKKTYKQYSSDDPKERIGTLDEFKLIFRSVSDKQMAWNELHRLTFDKSFIVRADAASVLSYVFSQIPNKQQAWEDLIKLSSDKNGVVRLNAASVLSSVFSYVPDKKQAWEDLVILTSDVDSLVIHYAASVLSSMFSYVPDEFKQQAWNDLHRMTNDEDSIVRSKAAFALGSAFFYTLDRQQVWKDLHKLINDKDSIVRSKAASALCSAFSYMPDEFKQQAWDDLVELIYDKYSIVRSKATFALCSVFSHVPNKQYVWEDLVKLAYNEDNYIRLKASSALGPAFSQVPDEFKQQAWRDLQRLTTDEKYVVRSKAAFALGSAFSQMPEEQRAWNDLHQMIKNTNNAVKSVVTDALGFAFSQIPDEFKQQAWNDLHTMTLDEDWYVRSHAATALGFAFSQIPDKFKQQAWNDLQRLINDNDWNVRSHTAAALGSVFSYVPDKQQAWKDLQKMTSDRDWYVRIYANYSLGRISIFKASQVGRDIDYKRELEKAIEFFKVAAWISSGESFNPSKFCLPFYCLFYTIIFKKQTAKEEVNKYLQEAEVAIGDSERKELLFEVIENLAKALSEVQNLGNLDLQGMKCELNIYMKYCDNVAELMKTIDERAPYVTGVLRKGIPLLNRDLKEILEGIQEEAWITCRESIGTTTEDIACTISREVKKWEVSNQYEMAKNIEDLAFILEERVTVQPENQYIRSKIKQMKNETNLINQYEILTQIIELIKTVKVVLLDAVVESGNKLGQELGLKIDNVSQKINDATINLKPGIKEEIEISSGIEIYGTGAKHIVTFSLQEISYVELKDDLERIKGKNINKLSELPERLAKEIKAYLKRNNKEDIIE